jgi:hypothetical protein
VTLYRVTGQKDGTTHDVEAVSEPAAALLVARQEFPYCTIYRSLGTPPGPGVFYALEGVDHEIQLTKGRYHVEALHAVARRERGEP